MHLGLDGWYLLSGWGGAERLIAALAEAMLGRGHEVTILVKAAEPGKAKEGKALFAAPDGAATLALDLASPEKAAAAREAVAAAGFDVVLSMSAGHGLLNFAWLLAGSGVPFVAAEPNHPTYAARHWNEFERYGALAAADFIQVLLEPYRNYYPKPLRRRIAVIGNPVPPAKAVDWTARAARTRRRLLAVGRFAEEDKRFALLVRAWALLAPDFPDWTLALVGDGTNREVYEALAKSLGVDSRLEMPGSTADVDAWYADADVFCLPSRQEGFPLVFAEASAWQLPLAGMASCEAAHELIAPGTGALAPDDTPASLAETLRPLLAAPPELRREMGEAAARAFDRFAPKAVFDQWEALFARAAARRGRTRLERILRDRWSPVLLNGAALEIASRPAPDAMGCDAGGQSVEAVVAKLVASHQALEREHGQLRKKYEILLGEFQRVAGHAAGVHGGRREKRR